MVGRILARLRRSGELHEPRRRRMSVHQRRWQRPYAIRKPADWTVERPGDLVELDTLDIRPLSSKIWKQFTARDVVSRWDTLELGRRATASAAAAVLDRLAERMPFPVRAISIDNGSEFMAEFEAACQARGIRLFVLPPRSPKLHGAVERANRTHTEEFYEVTDRRTGARGLPGRTAGLGDGVQHDPSPPVTGPAHPGRIPGLRRHRCVTDVLDEYRRWPDRGFGCSIPHPSRCLDPWGCVVSTGSGYRGTRAEDATGPRKSRGKKKYLATASRLSLSLLRQ